MKLLAAIWLAACCCDAGAQSFVSMGRLFTTPGERAQLDQRRSTQAASAPAGGSGAMSSVGDPSGAAPTFPGSPQAGGAPGHSAWADPASRAAAGAAPGAALTQAGAGGAGGDAAGRSIAGGAGGDAAAGAAGPGAGELRLDGVIRRRGGAATLIVNGELRPAPTRAGARDGGAVRLDSGGRSVVLRPGQRYDPATGEVHEAAR